jgi:ABC-type antimicrobial peptide transport system permease subunit
MRSRRTETGIRLALGADADDVRRMATLPGLRLTLLGVFVGGGGTAWLAGLFKGLLPPISALDPATFAITTGVLLSVAWLAAWGPARRSARLDPASALRDE